MEVPMELTPIIITGFTVAMAVIMETAEMCIAATEITDTGIIIPTVKIHSRLLPVKRKSKKDRISRINRKPVKKYWVTKLDQNTNQHPGFFASGGGRDF